MSPRPGPPLRKITINLFDSDVRYLQATYGFGWSEQLRDRVAEFVRQHKHTTHQVEHATVEDLAND